MILNTNPRNDDTDNDTFGDYEESSNDYYDPCVFDKIVEADQKYTINRNETWNGRIHIKSPVIINTQKQLTLENVNKIFIEDIKSTRSWAEDIFSVYGELISNDPFPKSLVYNNETGFLMAL